MPVISVIIPVYNVEHYLRRCLDSVLAQTFTDFECILIDDGSPDKSPGICDEYARKDNRFVVIHQENAGVSAARNAGLDIVRGEWLTFVDSDDWIEPDMLRVLYHNAVKHQSDVSICDVQRTAGNDADGSETTIKTKAKTTEIVMNGSQAIAAMCHGAPFNTSAVAKLLKSKFFSEYHIRYDIAIHYSEDALLYYMLFKHADKITYCSTPFYKYFANPHSITRTTDLTEKVKTCFLAYDKMLSIETDKRIRLCLLSRVVLEAYFKLIYCIEKQDYHSDAYQYLHSILKQNLLYLVFDRRCNFKYKVACVMILFPKLFRALYSIYSRKKT